MCIYKNSRYPCGHCYECLSKVRNDWSIRLQEQLIDTPIAYHAILTYDNEHLKRSKSGLATVCKKDVQDFLKRLRHKITNFKYFCVSEYGEITQRPHNHIIIFNVPLMDDRIYHNDLHVWTSEKLRSLIEASWQQGFVRYRSSYISSSAQLHYVLKDIYNWLDPIDLHKVEQKLKALKKKNLYDNFVQATYKPFFKNGCLDDRAPNYRIMSKNLGLGFINRVPRVSEEFQYYINQLVLPKIKDHQRIKKPDDFVACEDFYIHRSLYDLFEYDDQGKFLLPLEFLQPRNSEHKSAFEYHANIPKKVQKGNKFVTKDVWHIFPLPRYYRNILFDYGPRALLAIKHYSELRIKQQEYCNRYLDYDEVHDIPMSVLQAQINYDKYKQSRKDRKTQRIKENKSDNQ